MGQQIGNMSSVEELSGLLASTKPPKQLLHPTLHAPPYMVDPVVKLTGSFHLPPYNAEEQEAIREAKVAADKSGEQTRADLVFPNLMIGNMYAAEDAQYLASQGVTHLLNTAGLQTEPDCVRPNLEELEGKGIKVLTLPINDRAFVGIKEHFPTSCAWIREALQGGGKVLVNCFQGASRSATIVLAYLVEHEGLTLAEAVVKVKEGRDVWPNKGFLQQLIDWENKCNRKT